MNYRGLLVSTNESNGEIRRLRLMKNEKDQDVGYYGPTTACWARSPTSRTRALSVRDAGGRAQRKAGCLLVVSPRKVYKLS